MSADTLYWQTYSCGCVSLYMTTEAALPDKCDKHEHPWLQRYISRKAAQSVEQIDDNEKFAGVTHQNQIIARLPGPTQ